MTDENETPDLSLVSEADPWEDSTTCHYHQHLRYAVDLVAENYGIEGMDTQQRLALTEYFEKCEMDDQRELAWWSGPPDEDFEDSDEMPPDTPGRNPAQLLGSWQAHLSTLARFGAAGRDGEPNLFERYLADQITALREAWLNEAHRLIRIDAGGVWQDSPFDCPDDLDIYGHWHFPGGYIPLAVGHDVIPMGG